MDAKPFLTVSTIPLVFTVTFRDVSSKNAKATALSELHAQVMEATIAKPGHAGTVCELGPLCTLSAQPAALASSMTSLRKAWTLSPGEAAQAAPGSPIVMPDKAATRFFQAVRAAAKQSPPVAASLQTLQAHVHAQASSMSSLASQRAAHGASGRASKALMAGALSHGQAASSRPRGYAAGAASGIKAKPVLLAACHTVLDSMASAGDVPHTWRAALKRGCPVIPAGLLKRFLEARLAELGAWQPLRALLPALPPPSASSSAAAAAWPSKPHSALWYLPPSRSSAFIAVVAGDAAQVAVRSTSNSVLAAAPPRLPAATLDGFAGRLVQRAPCQRGVQSVLPALARRAAGAHQLLTRPHAQASRGASSQATPLRQLPGTPMFMPGLSTTPLECWLASLRAMGTALDMPVHVDPLEWRRAWLAARAPQSSAWVGAAPPAWQRSAASTASNAAQAAEWYALKREQRAFVQAAWAREHVPDAQFAVLHTCAVAALMLRAVQVWSQAPSAETSKLGAALDSVPLTLWGTDISLGEIIRGADASTRQVALALFAAGRGWDLLRVWRHTTFKQCVPSGDAPPLPQAGAGTDSSVVARGGAARLGDAVPSSTSERQTESSAAVHSSSLNIVVPGAPAESSTTKPQAACGGAQREAGASASKRQQAIEASRGRAQAAQGNRGWSAPGHEPSHGGSAPGVRAAKSASKRSTTQARAADSARRTRKRWCDLCARLYDEVGGDRTAHLVTPKHRRCAAVAHWPAAEHPLLVSSAGAARQGDGLLRAAKRSAAAALGIGPGVPSTSGAKRHATYARTPVLTADPAMGEAQPEDYSKMDIALFNSTAVLALHASAQAFQSLTQLCGRRLRALHRAPGTSPGSRVTSAAHPHTPERATSAIASSTAPAVAVEIMSPVIRRLNARRGSPARRGSTPPRSAAHADTRSPASLASPHRSSHATPSPPLAPPGRDVVPTFKGNYPVMRPKWAGRFSAWQGSGLAHASRSIFSGQDIQLPASMAAHIASVRADTVSSPAARNEAKLLADALRVVPYDPAQHGLPATAAELHVEPAVWLHNASLSSVAAHCKLPSTARGLILLAAQASSAHIPACIWSAARQHAGATARAFMEQARLACHAARACGADPATAWSSVNIMDLHAGVPAAWSFQAAWDAAHSARSALTESLHKHTVEEARRRARDCNKQQRHRAHSPLKIHYDQHADKHWEAFARQQFCAAEGMLWLGPMLLAGAWLWLRIARWRELAVQQVANCLPHTVVASTCARAMVGEPSSRQRAAATMAPASPCAKVLAVAQLVTAAGQRMHNEYTRCATGWPAMVAMAEAVACMDGPQQLQLATAQLALMRDVTQTPLSGAQLQAIAHGELLAPWQQSLVSSSAAMHHQQSGHDSDASSAMFLASPPRTAPVTSLPAAPALQPVAMSGSEHGGSSTPSLGLPMSDMEGTTPTPQPAKRLSQAELASIFAERMPPAVGPSGSATAAVGLPPSEAGGSIAPATPASPPKPAKPISQAELANLFSQHMQRIQTSAAPPGGPSTSSLPPGKPAAAAAKREPEQLPAGSQPDTRVQTQPAPVQPGSTGGGVSALAARLARASSTDSAQHAARAPSSATGSPESVAAARSRRASMSSVGSRGSSLSTPPATQAPTKPRSASKSLSRMSAIRARAASAAILSHKLPSTRTENISANVVTMAGVKRRSPDELQRSGSTGSNQDSRRRSLGTSRGVFRFDM